MNLRLGAGAIVLLAGYLAFGDFLNASILSTPEAFVADVGRGIGGAVTGVVNGVSGFFNG